MDTNQATNNRETWLRELSALMAPRFEELGKPIPPFRVGTGFTSGGQYCNAGGECWNKTVSAEGHFEIFIAPDRTDNMEIAGILCHELIHAAVGLREGHKGQFAKMCDLLGLLRPYTATTPGRKFIEWAQPFLDQLGPIPHAALKYSRLRGVRASAETVEGDEPAGDQDDEPGSSNQKKKQSTRMLKACCEECGYTVRLSKKWALELGAVCPTHGEMTVEGLDEEP